MRTAATRLPRALAASAALAATAAAGLLTAGPAAAVTWTPAKAASVSAYDYNGYKATIYARAAYAIPTGYVDAGSTMTVKKGSTTVATGRSSLAVKSGTYTTYDTVKYRKRTAYRAYHEYSEAVAIADSCTVATATVTDTSGLYASGSTYYGKAVVTYTGSCTASVYDDDGTEQTGTYTGTWAEDEWQFGIASLGAVVPESSVGDTVEYVDAPGTVTWSVPYTAYTYGSVITRYVSRTWTVVARNTRYITAWEWSSLKSGMSISRVQGIFGNPGYRYTTVGSYVVWAFDDVDSDGDYYDTYYLGFKNGGLYVW